MPRAPELLFTPLPLAALAAAALALPASAAGRHTQPAPDAPDRPWRPNITANGEIVPGSPSATSAASTGFVLPTNEALATLPAEPSIDRTRVYDLADLIDLAESRSPATRVAWNAAREAALAAGIARSSYLPRLTATALGGFQAVHGRASALGLNAGSDNSVGGGVAALSLQWLLFDFGQRRAIVEGADQATIAADIGFTAAHQALIHQVSLAFYAHAAARSRTASATRSLADAQAVQQAAEQRYQHGVGTVIEVAQAKQATAQARLAEVQAKGATEDAYVDLLAVMGIPPLTKIAIADASGHRLSPALGDDAEKVIASALGRRPDVLAAYASLKASLAGERAARAEFLPKFFVSANGAYAGGDLSLSGLPSIGSGDSPTLNLTNRRLGATIVGGVTVPLYDGGRRKAALEQARTRTDSARATLDRVRNDAIQQMVVANNALRTSLAAHEAAGELQAAAQTTFDAALAAYRNGVGSSTDVMLAERQLLEARNAHSDAYSTALAAAATLALASGVLGGAP